MSFARRNVPNSLRPARKPAPLFDEDEEPFNYTPILLASCAFVAVVIVCLWGVTAFAH